MWFKLSTTSAQDDYIESEKCSPPVQLLRNGLSESENYFALDELFDERLIEHFPNEVGRFVTLDGVLYFIPTNRFNDDRMIECFHQRGDDEHLINEDGVELWSGDQLCFKTITQNSTDYSSVILNLISEELDPNEVIAEAPISNLGTYADRVFKSKERISKLFEYSAQLGQASTLKETLDISTQFIFDLLPQATHIAVALLEPKSKSFPVASASKRNGGEVKVPVSRTLLKRVVETHSAILLTDVEGEVGGVMSVLAAGMKSTLVVPLWVGASIIGVIQVDNRDKLSAFAREELELLTVAASNISFAAESTRLIERLKSAEGRLKGGLSYMQSNDRSEASGLIGESSAMKNILTQIQRVRDLKVPVFINGETGTGKELIARALHYQSRRRDKLFVAQNCGALPENLLESELFGHVKGAFTGADREKKGLFELADGGSVFLDEVGEMRLSLQAKLLRVLQEGEIRPLGSNQSKYVDIRIISATHRNLQDMVREGTFREDLFYRLHVFPIALPPLRERADDVILLARHFLQKYAKDFGRDIDIFTQEALSCLKVYHWPGNVRELQNEVQRALISSFEGDVIERNDLSPHIGGIDQHSTDVVLEALHLQGGTLKEMMEYLEKLLLKRALEEHGHNKTQTAKALSITREGLHKKLARYEMN
jgi:transcriptional regulator with GAF, ATPase, and Fis domain